MRSLKSRRHLKRSAQSHLAAASNMTLEVMEPRMLLSAATIAEFSFSGNEGVSTAYISPSAGTTGVSVTNNQTSGTPVLTAIGMTFNGQADNEDITVTKGAGNKNFSEALWRIRGIDAAGDNGWNLAAPEYSQGAELDVNTTGFQNITLSFDWYSTTSGVKDLMVQYNTDITNANGWTNALSTPLVATANDYFGGAAVATPTNTLNLSAIAGANNDANFGIRLVSAYDPNFTPGAYSAANSTNTTQTLIANNGGNWRFDNIALSGTSEVPTAPQITQQPQAASVPQGETATFTAAATGFPTPTVQWEVSTNNGTSFAPVTFGTGATTDTFNTGPATTAMNGDLFEAVFTNTSGAPATTNAVGLMVETTPVITTQPLSQAINPGASASFSAVAVGATSQQWLVSTNNGASFAPVSPADNTTSLTVSPTEEQSGTEYEIEFSNSIGNTFSNPATLTVVGTPITQFIYTAPVASGSGGIGPANNPAPTLANGSTDSSQAIGFVNDYDGPQSFTEADILSTTGVADPSFSVLTWRIRGGGGGGPTGSAGAPDGWSQFAPEGSEFPQYAQGAQFDVDTVGYTNITLQFQWFSTTSGIRDMQEQYSPDGGSTWDDLGTPIQAVSNDFFGYNGAGYTPVLMNLQGIAAANNNPNFEVRLISAYDPALPLVDDGNLLINGGVGYHGQYASAATGAANAEQSLLFGGSNLSGTFTLTYDDQTTNPITYSSDPTTLAQNMTAALVALSNIGTNATTLANNISVAPALSGSGFTITFLGALGPVVQNNITADTTGLSGNAPTATVTTLVVGGSTGIIPYADGGGNWRLGDITFNGDGLNGGLGITQQPTNTSVVGSTNATFTAAAYSELADTVQWQVSTDGGHNFSDINGATLTTVTVSTDVELSENGNEYRAVFTNADGSATSQPATLTVVAPAAPAVTASPVSVSAVENETVSFSATATGSPLPTVQWEVNSGSGFVDVTTGTVTTSDADGSVISTYTLITDPSQNNDQFEAVFTNALTSAPTAPATLNVLAPETVITQWSFPSVEPEPANSPTPDIDIAPGIASVLGMDQTDDNSQNSPSVAAADVTSTPGTANPNFTLNLWRIRGGPTDTTGGAPGNGWNSVAPEYSQGAEWAVNTTGYQNVYATVDWYSTTQGIRDLQVQYTLDGSTWTNLGAAYIATANDYYQASPDGTTTPIVVNLTNIPGAANNPNLAIRMVSAYDPGLPLITDPPGTVFVDNGASLPEPHGEYATASSTPGNIIPYNDSSGNWRFGDIVFQANAIQPPVVSNFVVNNGQAQRANVTNLTITFSNPVVLGSGAITLLQRPAQAGGTATPESFNITNPSGDQQTYVITFSAAGDSGGPLPDGVYDLTVHSADVTDVFGNPMQADQTESFYRLYGDFFGQGSVGFSDLVVIAETFGESAGGRGYLSFAELNGDTSIGFAELAKLAENFGKSLSVSSDPTAAPLQIAPLATVVAAPAAASKTAPVANNYTYGNPPTNNDSTASANSLTAESDELQSPGDGL